MIISRAQAVNIIRNQTRGGFFGVQFVKKDKTFRSMLARTGVRKGVKGTGPVVNDPKHIIVWDAHKKDFRKINVDSVITLRVNGVDYVVLDRV